MTSGPGGAGSRIRQSARFPFDSVAWNSAAPAGRAFITMSRSWISPKAPRVCLFDRMSCRLNTWPDSFSILDCARSIVSSRCCRSPRLRAVRSALCPSVSPVRRVVSSSRDSRLRARRSCASAWLCAAWSSAPCSERCPSRRVWTVAPSPASRRIAQTSSSRPATSAQSRGSSSVTARPAISIIAARTAARCRRASARPRSDGRGCTGRTKAWPPWRAAARSSPRPTCAAPPGSSRGRPCG